MVAKRSLAAVVAFIGLVAGACAPASNTKTERYSPPPPMALVAIVDPSAGRLAEQLRQLEGVIRAGAMPGEAVVVMILQPSFGKTYTVQPGDNLDSIAADHGVTLAALEAANPQLGPLSGRNWKLIHPSERVLIPDGAAQDALLLVSRAPQGPPLPELRRIPPPPANPTDYQRAQYNHKAEADKATNDARVAQWTAEAAKSVQPWQAQVVAGLEQKARSVLPPARKPDRQMLSASLTAGLTTLQGLNGRRLLLILGGGEIGPTTLAPQSLAGVNLVIANLSSPKAAAAWSAAGAGAGADSVNTLDAALTRLQLPQVVNH
jgi:hypothetical protein